jgi:hypothetical protein
MRIVRDIALTARPAADGMITSSHRRPLAHLPAADPDAAEHDIRRLLRWLHYMWRLFRLARRTSALTPETLPLSSDLGVFVDQAAKAVPAQNAHSLQRARPDRIISTADQNGG